MNAFFPVFFCGALLLIFCSTGCSKEDNTPGLLPTISYPSTTLEATFHQSGNSAVPTISWNGDQGNISIAAPVPSGLRVDGATGQLLWDASLTVGTLTGNVVASNAEGQVTVPLTIENPIEGNFVGVYNGENYFALEFQADGTVTAASESATEPVTARGSWTAPRPSELFLQYTFDANGNEVTVSGDLIWTGNTFQIIGEWYRGNSIDLERLGGDFAITLE